LIFSLQNFLKPFNFKNSLQKHQDWNYKYIHNGLQHFPLTSPTLSSIPENILNEFNVLETDFVVNKKYFIDNFYANPNSENRSWFFKKKCNKERKYKNIFMISLHHIKYKSYSLIGFKCIMCLKIILHIHLQNMHVPLHLEIKLLFES